jgi:hypothetical protein
VTRRWCGQSEVCWLGCKSPWSEVVGVLRRHVPTKNRKSSGGDMVAYAMLRERPDLGDGLLVSKCCL